MSQLFLGLDSSTQSLSAIVIDYDSREVVYEHALNFDTSLPGYGTVNGVLPNPDPLIKHSPPQMWAEALDLLFGRMQTDGVALGEILAVSGSGQQHGSVYLKADGSFARPTAPIWMDASTAAECAAIEQALGGRAATAAATGSAAFERFTGPQIRRFAETEPAAYAATDQIALVSSYLAGLVAGCPAPIDHGDGAGMNLMDIERKTWHPDALAATAPDLASKLPPLASSTTVIGPVGTHWVEQYGLNPQADAVTWSGDNPCSLVGLGLIREGMVAISLGTSYTYFGYLETCHTDPHGEGHVFVAPTGDYMTLICFKNGSLACEQIRDQFGLDWDGFSRCLATTQPRADGGIILPYYETEIVPRVNRPGVHRFDLDAADAAANCRAVVEAQLMSMRIHSRWMEVRPTRILATGGGSVNEPFLQVVADVMQCPVLRIEVSQSAALGAALMAAYAHFDHAGRSVGWEEIVAGFTDPIAGSEVRPDPATRPVYDRLLERYADCERRVLGDAATGG